MNYFITSVCVLFGSLNFFYGYADVFLARNLVLLLCLDVMVIVFLIKIIIACKKIDSIIKLIKSIKL